MLGDAAGPVVLEISVPRSTVYIRTDTWFFAVGNTIMTRLAVVPDADYEPHSYVLNLARNTLIHVGCGFRASSWMTAHGARPFSNGSCSCHKDDRRVRLQRCHGTGYYIRMAMGRVRIGWSAWAPKIKTRT